VGSPHEGLEEIRSILLGEPLDPGLYSLQVDDAEDGHVAEHRGDKGMFDDLDIGDIGKLRHDKSCGPHHRGHQLAVGRGCNLHGPCDLRPEAYLLHQGNGHGPCGDGVGDGAARDRAHGSAGYHRGLSWSSPEPAHGGEGEVDQEFPGPDPVQEGAEQDEEKDEGCGDPDGNPPNSLHGQEFMVDKSPDAVSAVGDDIGHVGTDKNVDDEDDGNEGQGRGHGPPRGLQDEEDEGAAEDEVHSRGISDAKDDVLVEDRGVDGG